MFLKLAKGLAVVLILYLLHETEVVMTILISAYEEDKICIFTGPGISSVSIGEIEIEPFVLKSMLKLI